MPKGLTLRKVQRTGNSLTVALPAAAVRVLRARPGRPVQVLVGRRGTVIIAPVSRRIGVKQEYLDLVAQLTQARREVEHLRKKIGGRPLRIYNEGFAQGFSKASTGLFYDVERLHAQLRVLLAGIQSEAPPPRTSEAPTGPAPRSKGSAATAEAEPSAPPVEK